MKTETKPTHTPTPWHTDDFGSIKPPKGVQTLSGSVSICAASSSSPEAVANAAFIVRACNNFEDLVDAIKVRLRISETGGLSKDEYDRLCVNWHEMAEKLIAKAEGR